jgi:hypothetical protein
MVGLHRASAALASQAFENRTTYKEYIAVVEGTMLPIPLPILDMKLEEIKAKKVKAIKRKLSDPITTWQDRAIRVNLDKSLELLNQIKDTNMNQDDALTKLLSTSYDSYVVNHKSRKELRKYLKSQGLQVPVVDEGGPLEQDKIVTPSSRTPASDHLNDKLLPPKETSEEHTTNRYGIAYRLPLMNLNMFYLNAPIAEVTSSFMMEAGHTQNPGLWSETLFEILGYGSYQGREVTKLRLVPQTGR